MKTKLLFAGLAIMAMTAVASAQNPTPGRCNGQGNGTGRGAAYVDKNKNGVCDNYENRLKNGKAGKGNRNGYCNGTGQGRGKGRNFVDANKNGVCDNFENRNKK